MADPNCNARHFIRTLLFHTQTYEDTKVHSASIGCTVYTLHNTEYTEFVKRMKTLQLVAKFCTNVFCQLQPGCTGCVNNEGIGLSYVEPSTFCSTFREWFADIYETLANSARFFRLTSRQVLVRSGSFLSLFNKNSLLNEITIQRATCQEGVNKSDSSHLQPRWSHPEFRSK